MKLVIDCNVFVSAALGSKLCQQVIEKSSSSHIIFYSEEILNEIRATFLKRKFVKIKRESKALLDQFMIAGLQVNPTGKIGMLPDPDDEIYLNTALHAGADAIITGNTKHFPQENCGGIRILTPREFLEAIP